MSLLSSTASAQAASGNQLLSSSGTAGVASPLLSGTMSRQAATSKSIVLDAPTVPGLTRESQPAQRTPRTAVGRGHESLDRVLREFDFVDDNLANCFGARGDNLIN
jgi:hypothetical protein